MDNNLNNTTPSAPKSHMHMHMNKNAIIVILAAMVFGLAFLLWGNTPVVPVVTDDMAQGKKMVVDQQVASDTATVEYKMIPEWGLKYAVTPENKDVMYSIDNTTRGDVIGTMTLTSAKLQNEQQVKGGYKVIIVRYAKKPTFDVGREPRSDDMRPIGDYYYVNQFEAQSPCPHFGVDGKIDIAIDPICTAELEAENNVFSTLEVQ